MMDTNKKRSEKYTTGKSLVVDLTVHAVLALVLSFLFYFFTGKLSWAVLCIVGGVFIDVDHFMDHFRYYGRKFDIMDFLFHLHLDSGKIYLFFHSWELIALLWCLSFIAGWLIPLAAGMTVHLLVDQFLYRNAKWLYFISYRWYHGFERDNILHTFNYKNTI